MRITRQMKGQVSWWKLCISPWTDLLLLTLLIFLALKIGHTFLGSLELDQYDETFFLTHALHGSKPGAEWSPAYSEFLSLYFRFTDDAFRVLQLNTLFLSTLITACLYLLSRRIGGTPLTASLASFLFLISFVNIPSVTKSTHLSTFGWLAALLLASSQKRIYENRLHFFGFLSLIALPLAYVRPENQIAFLLFGSFAIYYGWRNREFKALGSWVLMAAGLIWALTSHFGIFQTTRAMRAFSLGFKTAAETGGLGPRLAEEEYVRLAFGAANGLGELALANSEAFLWYLAATSRQFFFLLGQVLTHFFVPETVEKITWIAFPILLSGSLFQFGRAKKNPPGADLIRFTLAVLCLPTALAGLLFWSYERYLVFIPVALLLLTSSVRWPNSVSLGLGRRAQAGLGLITATLLGLGSLACERASFHATPFLLQARASVLNQISPRGDCVVVPVELGIHFPCAKPGGQPPEETILRSNPEIVLVSKSFPEQISPDFLRSQNYILKEENPEAVIYRRKPEGN